MYKKYLVYCEVSKKVFELKMKIQRILSRNMNYKFDTSDIDKQLKKVKCEFMLYLIMTTFEYFVGFYMYKSIMRCYKTLPERIVHTILIMVSSLVYAMFGVFQDNCIKSSLKSGLGKEMSDEF